MPSRQPNTDPSPPAQFPPRLKFQLLKPHQWARVPNQSLRVHALKLSDIRGWSIYCEDPVPMLALHIPEEDRCIDILELIEHERLLRWEGAGCGGAEQRGMSEAEGQRNRFAF